MSSLIKEINRYVKRLLLRKTDVLKTWILSERKFEEMHCLWRAKMYKVYSRKRLFWQYRLQLSFVYKSVSQISFICFDWEKKGFYQSSKGNEVDFTDIMNVSSNILAKNWNFKILRHTFEDKRTMITTALTFSCHWKTLLPFCAFLTLTVNYRKIVQKSKLYHSKQHWIGYLMTYDVI